MNFTLLFISFLSLVHTTFSSGIENENLAKLDSNTTFVNNKKEILLDNDWDFYWEQLIEPGNFNSVKPSATVKLKSWTNFNIYNTKLPSFGYATYKLNFSTPLSKQSRSLYIPKIFSSYKLWLNGELISEIGKVNTTKEKTLHRRFAKIIPLKTDETNFEIVIQVANFYHSKAGITEPLKLSTNQHLQSVKYKQIMADMFFIGSLVFIGAFFLLFYCFYWNKDKSVLYFAILCFSLSYMALSDRYMPLTAVFKNLNWILTVKIEYISLFIAGASASLFFNDIFANFVHKIYPKIIIVAFCFICILVISIPPPYFTKILSYFFLLIICNLLYVIYIIIRAIITKREESILLLVSMLLGFIVFSFHLFFFLDGNENIIIYINFGYIIVFLLLSMLLMTRFSDSFKELEIAKNIAIEQKREISVASKELYNVNLKLEENLALLEDYNTELDSFNHIVSHDLKSPLISIYSLVNFIEEDLKDILNRDTKSHLNLLKDVVVKMESLINGLLEYSKIAKNDKKKEYFSLNDLLEKVISIVDYNKQSIINLPIDDIDIYANKLELNHVFQNLLSNSIKHNDKEKAEITISVLTDQDGYLFSVSDNGPGVPPEYHDKIFNIFSQLKTSEDVESTGIGLAIVKKIISKNNGNISVSSDKGKGLKISFSWKY